MHTTKTCWGLFMVLKNANPLPVFTQAVYYYSWCFSLTQDKTSQAWLPASKNCVFHWFLISNGTSGSKFLKPGCLFCVALFKLVLCFGDCVWYLHLVVWPGRAGLGYSGTSQGLKKKKVGRLFIRLWHTVETINTSSYSYKDFWSTNIYRGKRGNAN